MELTNDDIKDIALLARVSITDAENESYRHDLSSVLHYFEKLQEVNTDDVEEIGHITGMTDVYRADAIMEPSIEEKVRMMDNVSRQKDGYIKVQSVL
ncbi:MAG: Asp-tRNA(Asn)/Glu-tRNA(Gln) amidotransferase subunit GatC [Parcubacteria group bacterium]|jgi:aspartyl-tRNA(Asn)/glutamyl-tRNA(Gln) amidotransferase subunit C